MTLTEFRSNPQLRQWVANWLLDPTAQLLLHALDGESPLNQQAILPQHMIGVQLGKVYGYDEAIKNLKRAALPPELPPRNIEETWNVPVNQ